MNFLLSPLPLIINSRLHLPPLLSSVPRYSHAIEITMRIGFSARRNDNADTRALRSLALFCGAYFHDIDAVANEIELYLSGKPLEEEQKKAVYWAVVKYHPSGYPLNSSLTSPPSLPRSLSPFLPFSLSPFLPLSFLPLLISLFSLSSLPLLPIFFLSSSYLLPIRN